ncbi:ATP-binding protein [Desulfobulbus elongatus]|uniref:ATP-binding protein n=1 Tax=Desulfobulbus elongatus TaxID=53332 RepID=UPI000A01702F|nr:ATP-binding protein [Desulfobulbus elongatus]
MSKSPLKKLAIEHLRGSVKPFMFTFEKGKKMTFIYGENGTGKSTICDALEFLGKGKVGSLEKRGLGKTNRYWQTLGKKPADVSVALETASGMCKAVVGSAEVIVTPAEKKPLVEVLRRNQILSLIEATAGEKYAAISRFIDVTSAEASEAALRDLIKNIEKNRDVATARVQENLDTINQFWEEGGKVGASSLAWANAESKRDAAVFDTEMEEIGKLQTAYIRIKDHQTRIETAQKKLEIARSSEKEAQKNLEVSIAKVTHEATDVLAVLQAAKDYLIKHPASAVCPLCESAEKVDGLNDRINSRLLSFSSLQTAQTTQRAKSQDVKGAESGLESVQNDAREAATAFKSCLDQYTWPPDISLPGMPIPEDFAQWPAWFADTVSLPETWKNAETIRQDKKQFINTLKRSLNTYNENFIAQKDIDSLLPRMKRSLEIAEEERRKYTDATLSNIATEVGRLYEIVHPGEGLDKISLELDPKKRASLEIGASFCGKTGTPPQAYFSDSHLDTLAAR